MAIQSYHDVDDWVISTLERHGLDPARVLTTDLVVGPTVVSGYLLVLDERGEPIVYMDGHEAKYRKTPFCVPYLEN